MPAFPSLCPTLRLKGTGRPVRDPGRGALQQELLLPVPGVPLPSHPPTHSFDL